MTESEMVKNPHNWNSPMLKARKEEMDLLLAVATDEDLQYLMGRLKKLGRMFAPNWFFAEHFEYYTKRKWTADDICGFLSWTYRTDICDIVSDWFDGWLTEYAAYQQETDKETDKAPTS